MSSAIGGATTFNTNEPAIDNNAFAELSSEEFIRILTTELSNQDPFEPTDSAAILEQLSSIRNIESQAKLESSLESLVTQNAISAAGGLIGQYVTGLNSSNQTVEGLVTSLRVENGQPILRVQTEDGLKDLEADRITDVENLGDLDTQIVQQLLANLQVLDSASLIGKTVTGVDTAGVTREGVVTSVTVEDGQIRLELEGDHVMPIANVTRFA